MVDAEYRKQLQSARSLKSRIMRCPYCVEAGEFKEMTAGDGADSHMCARCGHLAMATNPAFECTCAKCVSFRVF